MSRSKPGTSATCSASRRSSYQARGAGAASSCLANSSNARSSTDQTGTAGSGICSNQRKGAAIFNSRMRGASLHTLKGVLGRVVLKDNVCRAQALAYENKKADELSLSGFLT